MFLKCSEVLGLLVGEDNCICEEQAIVNDPQNGFSKIGFQILTQDVYKDISNMVDWMMRKEGYR